MLNAPRGLSSRLLNEKGSSLGAPEYVLLVSAADEAFRSVFFRWTVRKVPESLRGSSPHRSWSFRTTRRLVPQVILIQTYCCYIPSLRLQRLPEVNCATMNFYTSLMLIMLAAGVSKSYVIPQYLSSDGEYLIPFGESESHFDESILLRERRSPQGNIDFSAGMGPGRTGSAGLGYDHQVWKGRGGESLHLGGTYMGDFGNGKPRHNFGVGGTFKF
ncbi:hypothetical protein AAG570_006377 [Ranatra chinensis]|uniref:Uncharacterized protein n=1 Tax=Ranatra chinensis TaxID=642074 RepID=A0ABD0ZAW1_9HEMI